MLVHKQPLNHSIVVTVSDIKPSKGSIFIALYDVNNFLTTTYSLTKVVVAGKVTTQQITLPTVPTGTYAIAVYQDVNNNRQLDKNFVGLPVEPFGFSNNVRPVFSAPSFGEVKFRHSNQATALHISLD